MTAPIVCDITSPTFSIIVFGLGGRLRFGAIARATFLRAFVVAPLTRALALVT